MLFLMQMTKLKNGTKTYHSKVPLRFIKITVDYTEHLILKIEGGIIKNNPPPIN